MKRNSIYAHLLFLAVFAHAEPTLTIGENSFDLAFKHQDSEHRLFEFTTNSEPIESWTKLTAIREYPKLSDPHAYVMNMAMEYKKKYPHMDFSAGWKEDKKDCWVDYIAYPRGYFVSKKKRYVEWNYFRAIESSRGGIIVLQYAERAKYKKGIEEAFSTLDIKNLRKRMMPILAEVSIEPVELAND